MHEIT